ncbi:hypothetical protein CDAR_20321 [Caerostris darwini]|uniref:Uncharacterized protein n=1 Tax=Caerostris darwini TaxID=1538125 RepID=A0AAV4NQQ1_9ARAC|nr:hypothetical protein CDAR_20321 [Caerostris darwini]
MLHKLLEWHPGEILPQSTLLLGTNAFLFGMACQVFYQAPLITTSFPIDRKSFGLALLVKFNTKNPRSLPTPPLMRKILIWLCLSVSYPATLISTFFFIDRKAFGLALLVVPSIRTKDL